MPQRDKDRKQRVREKGREQGEGGKEYLPWRDKGLWLHREKTDVAHRQTAVWKGEGKPVLG